MNMSVKDFMCMTLWQYYSARESHQRMMVESWRQTRLTIHTIARVMGGSKSLTNDVTKFLPLPFDEDFKSNKTPEQQNKENLLVIERMKRAGYLKPIEDGN